MSKGTCRWKHRLTRRAAIKLLGVGTTGTLATDLAHANFASHPVDATMARSWDLVCLPAWEKGFASRTDEFIGRDRKPPQDGPDTSMGLSGERAAAEVSHFAKRSEFCGTGIKVLFQFHE